jgi:hypothetical protein
MTAARFSRVKPEGASLAFALGKSCDSDITGGSFKTFSPHPVRVYGQLPVEIEV